MPLIYRQCWTLHFTTRLDYLPTIHEVLTDHLTENHLIAFEIYISRVDSKSTKIEFSFKKQKSSLQAQFFINFLLRTYVTKKEIGEVQPNFRGIHEIDQDIIRYTAPQSTSIPTLPQTIENPDENAMDIDDPEPIYNTACMICLLDDIPLRKLPCRHGLCNKCLADQVLIGRTLDCPMCKRPMIVDYKKVDPDDANANDLTQDQITAYFGRKVKKFFDFDHKFHYGIVCNISYIKTNIVTAPVRLEFVIVYPDRD